MSSSNPQEPYIYGSQMMKGQYVVVTDVRIAFSSSYISAAYRAAHTTLNSVDDQPVGLASVCARSGAPGTPRRIESGRDRRQEPGAAPCPATEPGCCAPQNSPELSATGTTGTSELPRTSARCRAVVGRRRAAPPRALGEDDDLAAALERAARHPHHRRDRVAAERAVDADGIESRRRPAEERDVHQLLLGDEGRRRSACGRSAKMSQSLMCLAAMMQGPSGMFSAPSTLVRMPTTQRRRKRLELPQYCASAQPNPRAPDELADGCRERSRGPRSGRGTDEVEDRGAGSPGRSSTSSRPDAALRRFREEAPYRQPRGNGGQARRSPAPPRRCR